MICCLAQGARQPAAPDRLPDSLDKSRPDTVNQKDLIDIFRSVFDVRKTRVKAEPGKTIYFSFLPTASTIPGGGRALITSTTAGFYLGNRKTTNLSSISFSPYWNFHQRYGIPIRSNIWLKDNKWFISGDSRFMVYPQYTWGLGGRPRPDEKLLVDYSYIRLYQSILRRIKPYLLLGIGYDIDYRINIQSQTPTDNLAEFSGYDLGTRHGQNSFSAGPTLNLLYDTRNNSLNPLPGCYANIIYRYNSPMFGSSRKWESLYLDIRKYISFSHSRQQNTLALWAYFWTTLDSGAPYLDLPSIGWDPFNRSGRGFDQNRYRGRGLIDVEAEYRRDITRNGLLGFVVFANANSVTEPVTGQYKYVHPAAGAGLRIKFNKGSNTNIGFDFARSRNNSAFNLSIGEAF
ncbi:hypothetical protein GCM10027037_06260 [Mucilaginibacter koreensis]